MENQNKQELSPKLQTYLHLKTSIHFVVEITSRQFYWASREDMMDERFTKEKADALWDIMYDGKYYNEEMVKCYYNERFSICKYDFNRMKKWAEKVNDSNELFDHLFTRDLNKYMERIERCFQEITSNGWAS